MTNMASRFLYQPGRDALANVTVSVPPKYDDIMPSAGVMIFELMRGGWEALPYRVSGLVMD